MKKINTVPFPTSKCIKMTGENLKVIASLKQTKKYHQHKIFKDQKEKKPSNK